MRSYIIPYQHDNFFFYGNEVLCMVLPVVMTYKCLILWKTSFENCRGTFMFLWQVSKRFSLQIKWNSVIIRPQKHWKLCECKKKIGFGAHCVNSQCDAQNELIWDAENFGSWAAFLYKHKKMTKNVTAWHQGTLPFVLSHFQVSSTACVGNHSVWRWKASVSLLITVCFQRLSLSISYT